MSGSVDSFGTSTFLLATGILLYSVIHFISNQHILSYESFPLFYAVNGFPKLLGNGLWFVLCPATHLVMYLFFWYVLNHPKEWVFPVLLTRENANRQFNLLRHNLLALQLLVSSFLIVGQISSARIAEALIKGSEEGLSEYFVPTFFMLFFVWLVQYIVKATINA